MSLLYERSSRLCTAVRNVVEVDDTTRGHVSAFVRSMDGSRLAIEQHTSRFY